jgi:hypothetical protein
MRIDLHSDSDASDGAQSSANVVRRGRDAGYFVRFGAAGSPYGHSRHVDLKTLYVAKAGALITRSTKGQMPAALLSRRPHTHNALDDAVEQAELFQNLMAWTGKE